MSRVYALTWVTDQLAVGPAPMSHEQLDSLKNDGIHAIMNLCGEYTDLHVIESSAGFEVYHIPLADEQAPDLAELEKALAWLDEAIYLGKKVLIHCRHGIGRTGTVLNAYLLRRGLGHRLSWLKMRKLRSRPANFDQWRTVRRYGKKSPKLKIREPSLEMRRAFDIGPLFQEYESIINKIESELEISTDDRCGKTHDKCCHIPVSLSLIEAAYITYGINTLLSSEKRLEIIDIAKNTKRPGSSGYSHTTDGTEFVCPLLVSGQCIVFSSRPLKCRMSDLSEADITVLKNKGLYDETRRLSLELWYEIAESIAEKDMPEFYLTDVVSGRYVQELFHLMTEKK